MGWGYNFSIKREWQTAPLNISGESGSEESGSEELVENCKSYSHSEKIGTQFFISSKCHQSAISICTGIIFFLSSKPVIARPWTIDRLFEYIPISTSFGSQDPTTTISQWLPPVDPSHSNDYAHTYCHLSRGIIAIQTCWYPIGAPNDPLAVFLALPTKPPISTMLNRFPGDFSFTPFPNPRISSILASGRRIISPARV